MERGMEPSGISPESSWRRTFCQSEKMLLVWSRLNSREKQRSLAQRTGGEYLKSYSTPTFKKSQFSHLKAPIFNSGFTSVVRVIVP